MIEAYENQSSSIDAFSDSKNGYNNRAQQITKGAFQGIAKVVFGRVVTVALRGVSQTVYEEGALAEGHAAVKFMLTEHDVMVAGHKYSASEVSSIPVASGYNQMMLGGTQFISLSLNIPELESFCGREDAEEVIYIINQLQQPRSVASFVKIKLTFELYCFVERVFAGSIRPEDQIFLIDFYSSVLDQLVMLPVEAPITTRQNDRQHIIKRALDFIHSQPVETLTIPALLSHLHASRRSVEYAFQKILGVSPKLYITSVRLNRVREELLLGERHVAIAQIARKYGVTHFGRFSQSYSEQFGELPSETRKRACR